MTDNYVRILVKATDDAKPDMDALKARLQELGHEVATARAEVNDEDAAAKLDALQAKLLNLDKKTANPKISMSGALSAEAQIHAVEAAMKKLDTTAADGGTGWKSRASAFAGAAASLTGLGDAMGVANPEASMFQRVMSGAGLATGLLEPVAAGATVAVGGLASGLVSAGAGLGVFGLVAKGAYSQAQTALTAYNAAQSTTGKAAQQDMTKYQAALKALPPSQQAFVKSIEGAQNAWQSFVANNTAGVTQILDKGLGLLPKVFSAMQPLLAPTEKALGGIIDKIGKGLDSSGFKSFMSTLTQNTGPAITKLGDAIGHIVVGIGGILKAFMPVSQTVLGGIDKMTEAFAKWGSTLSQHTGFQSMMQTFKTETPIAVGILKNLAEILKNVAGGMAGLATGSNSKTLLQVLEPLSGILAQLSKNQDLMRFALYLLAAADAGKKLKNAFTGISTVWSTFSSGVDMLGKFGKAATDASMGAKLAAAATRVWTGIQAAFDVVMDANPIMLVVIAIAAVVAAVILAYTHFAAFRAFVKTAMHDVVAAVEDVWNWIKGHWPLLLAILTGPIGLAAAFIIDHWHQILSGAESMINAVVSWFRGLPGRIISAVAALPSMLFNMGVAVLEGLLHGLISMAAPVVGWVENFAGKVGHAFASALHILSPSKVFEGHGKMIAAGLIQGMDGSRGLVASSARALAGSTVQGAASGYGTAAGAGAGGHGQITLQIQAGGGGSGLDGLFMQWLKNNVRVSGGDPRIFNKKVQFI